MCVGVVGCSEKVWVWVWVRLWEANPSGCGCGRVFRFFFFFRERVFTSKDGSLCASPRLKDFVDVISGVTPTERGYGVGMVWVWVWAGAGPGPET